MQIEIDGNIYDVEIIKKNNRNTYVRVKDGKIVVTTNYLTNKNSIIKLIMDNKKSIIQMINKDSKKMDKNDNFYYFGKKYDVIYGFSDIDITSDKIYAIDKKCLDKYINKKIIDIYSDRLDYWYNIFEEKIPRPNLKIRKMTSRWGVCNIRNHNVTLNYHLSKYDISCLDYVIVHELSHFIHPNHSKEFWNFVYKYYPKYKECRKMLKE
ncbi:MAG: M48 family metallopeptidase [Bacilli bacterium]|nr:M48 family metallopeptidase [Bacilli bacterium]